MIKIKIDEEFVCDGFKFVFRKVDGKLKFTNLGPSRGGKKDFEPPTVEEVIEFFKSKDFPEQLAREFHEYYALGDWKDKNGNQVKHWKQKAVSVWLKSDRKEKKQPQTQDSEFRF